MVLVGRNKKWRYGQILSMVVMANSWLDLKDSRCTNMENSIALKHFKYMQNH